MSVVKQIPSLCKLYSFYEEIPQGFLDESDVDSCFYHNIFDIFQSQHPIVCVSKGWNKKTFAIILFEFGDLKTQQRYILQENWISPRENSLLWSTVCAIFTKLLITLASVYRFPYRSPKLKLDLHGNQFFLTESVNLNNREIHDLYTNRYYVANKCEIVESNYDA